MKQVENGEKQKQQDQSPRQVADVLRPQSFKFNRAIDAFINVVDHIPKNDLSTKATSTRNTQEPNQLAATLLVSCSPSFHFLYTFTAPTNPMTAPMAYIRF